MKNQKQLLHAIILSAFAIVNISLSSYQPGQNKAYVIKVEKVKYFLRGTSRYLRAFVTFTNATNDTLKYLSMTCQPIIGLYQIDSQYLKFDDSVSCISNLPITLKLLPHTTRLDSILLKFKQNYTESIKYRIGFLVIKNEGNNLLNMMTGKKLRDTIIWSSPTEFKN